jgi:hypothetical protein
VQALCQETRKVARWLVKRAPLRASAHKLAKTPKTFRQPDAISSDRHSRDALVVPQIFVVQCWNWLEALVAKAECG